MVKKTLCEIANNLSKLLLIDVLGSIIFVTINFLNPEILTLPFRMFSGFGLFCMQNILFQYKSRVALYIGFTFALINIFIKTILIFKKNNKIVGLIASFLFTLDLITIIYFYASVNFIESALLTSIFLLVISLTYNILYIILAILYTQNNKYNPDKTKTKLHFNDYINELAKFINIAMLFEFISAFFLIFDNILQQNFVTKDSIIVTQSATHFLIKQYLLNREYLFLVLGITISLINFSSIILLVKKIKIAAYILPIIYSFDIIALVLNSIQCGLGFYIFFDCLLVVIYLIFIFCCLRVIRQLKQSRVG